nr:hypothetical protein KPHV_86170 [Kitasatospora purpeofusca]
MSAATATAPLPAALPGVHTARAVASQGGLAVALLASANCSAEIRRPEGQDFALCQYQDGRRTEVHRLPKALLSDKERRTRLVEELLAAAVPGGDRTPSTGICFVDGRCEDAVGWAGTARRALAVVVGDLLVLVVVPVPATPCPRAAAPSVYLVRPADSDRAPGEGAAL